MVECMELGTDDESDEESVDDTLLDVTWGYGDSDAESNNSSGNLSSSDVTNVSELTHTRLGQPAQQLEDKNFEPQPELSKSDVLIVNVPKAKKALFSQVDEVSTSKTYFFL